MKTAPILLFFFILGLTALLILRYVQVKSKQAFTPLPSDFSLNPPAQALTGTLTITKGKAMKFSRTGSEYEEASTGAQILIGESVATKENSAATVSVNGIATAVLESKAELVFANLFAENMLLLQKSGKITYNVNPEKQLSARTLHALISLTPGSTTINIIDTDMSVSVKTGSAKVALVDTDNNTRVWNLKEGQRANIDDTAREVFLVGKR